MKTPTLQTSRRETAEDYLALVREFPLRPLRTKADHAAALKMLARFAGRDDLSPGQDA